MHMLECLATGQVCTGAPKGFIFSMRHAFALDDSRRLVRRRTRLCPCPRAF